MTSYLPQQVSMVLDQISVLLFQFSVALLVCLGLSYMNVTHTHTSSS